jgi:prepilin-type N-terminal cleavage/methylation domain-containing protein
MSHRPAFTLIEVVASLLVLSLGLTAAIALLVRSRHQGDAAVVGALALPTAIGILHDPTPLLSSQQRPDWNVTGADATGYINGFYVVRSEANPTSLGGMRAVDVTVAVYLPSQPEPVARLVGRQVRGVRP